MIKFVKILIYLILFFLAIVCICFYKLDQKCVLTNYDISYLEHSFFKAYEDFGYNKPFFKPVYLNFKVQEYRFNAQKEFYEYMQEYFDENPDPPVDFLIDDVIAYKYDLNDDGFDEIIGRAKFKKPYKNKAMIMNTGSLYQYFECFYVLVNTSVFNASYQRNIKGIKGYSVLYRDKIWDNLYIMPTKSYGYYDIQGNQKDGVAVYYDYLWTPIANNKCIIWEDGNRTILYRFCNYFDVDYEYTMIFFDYKDFI